MTFTPYRFETSGVGLAFKVSGPWVGVPRFGMRPNIMHPEGRKQACYGLLRSPILTSSFRGCPQSLNQHPQSTTGLDSARFYNVRLKGTVGAQTRP